MMTEPRKLEMQPDANRSDYKCPLCSKEFQALDVLSLMQPLANPSATSGEFSLNCDVCGTEIDQKEKEQETTALNDMVQRFNVGTEALTSTLKTCSMIDFEP